ncbi:MAG: Dabb family protein [Actinomycetota bacterium]
MFSWNEDATADDIAATTAAINGLPGEIEAIRSFDHGADLGVSDQQYDYSLVATFDSLDDFAEYRAHPTHVALVEDYIDPFVADRTSVQFGEDRS